ncbi:MAG: hypothetical protein ABIG20_05350 [archaeon]
MNKPATKAQLERIQKLIRFYHEFLMKFFNVYSAIVKIVEQDPSIPWVHYENFTSIAVKLQEKYSIMRDVVTALPDSFNLSDSATITGLTEKDANEILKKLEDVMAFVKATFPELRDSIRLFKQDWGDIK